MKIRIAIDAMGGDYAPFEIVKGAIMAAREYEEDTTVFLIGDETAINENLSLEKSKFPNIEVIHTSEKIEMHESPTRALKSKPKSSISVGAILQKSGEIDAFVSVGNTGALYASSLMTLGRIKGVRRPTIGTIMPAEKKETAIFDIGANPNCRPLDLLQFAIMGSIYVEHIFGWKDPKVGLLNIGEEQSKGNELSLESYELFKNNLPNFYGNVEGGDILKGKVDVIVCDGFVGNIVLKFGESFYQLLKLKVEQNLKNKPFAKLGALMMMPALKGLRKDIDYQEYGGVPLLGVNGVSIIGHGHSSRIAIKNAVRVARKTVKEKINEHIAQEIEKSNITQAKIKTEKV